MTFGDCMTVASRVAIAMGGNVRVMASLGAGLAILASVAARPATAQAEVVPAQTLRDVAYLTVEDRALHLDAYLHPDAAKVPGPVLVHFHGGGWARGERPASWAGFRPYLAAGFSVVTVQYRLAGEASAPAAVQDARCALHWVGANANSLGFDRKRIILSGTSAGAHIALMAGLLPEKNDVDLDQCQDAPRAAAILDFFGPTDLTAQRAGSAALHPSVARWIGERPDAVDIARQMSPVSWLAADSPPIFIAHGDADPVVPLSQSLDLKRRLDALEVRSGLFVVTGGGHGNFVPASQ